MILQTAFENGGGNGAEGGADSAAAAYMATMVIMMVFWIIWIIIAILMCIWVYKDAKERDDVNETLWLIIVLLTGIIGFLIYYFVIRKEK